MSHHRIYVAGPYSAPTRGGVENNIRKATIATHRCMRLGHDAHCPHAATDHIEVYDKQAYSHAALGYEDYMRLDFGLIRYWATALLYLASSPGADRELALAEELGLVIFRSVDEVPNVRDQTPQPPTPRLCVAGTKGACP